MSEANCVVYRILNTVTGKSYVGATSNFEYRKSQHLGGLKNNKHHSQKLQRSYNLHGQQAFEWSTLEYGLSRDAVEIAEKKWIAYFDSYRNGYNMNAGGLGGAWLEVEWDGVKYESLSRAANELGKSISVLGYHVSMGKKSDNDIRPRVSRKTKPIIDGVEYPSNEAASEATGRSVTQIIGERMKGKLPY